MVQGKAKKRLVVDPQVTPRLALTLAREALSQLEMAARNLRVVGAANTLERVKLAISSCKGAVRNMEYRIIRQYRISRQMEREEEHRG